MPPPDAPSGPSSSESPDSTSTTLLQKVQTGSPEAWSRLVLLYAPVVARWCRRAGLQPEDSDDVLQEVFRAVARKVADFRRDPAGGSFHAWLHTITHNKVRDHFRRWKGQPQAAGGSDVQALLEEVPAPNSGALSSVPDAEPYSLLRRGLDLVQGEFEAKTWQAFWRAVVDDQDTAVIAADLGLSANAVRVAKSRVLRRLRQELGDLLA
jgi:RNA polymerase sigma-70 factor (ECF subfamily)